MLHLLFCVHLEVSGLRFGGYLPRCPEFSEYRWVYKHQRFMVWSQREQDKIPRRNEREWKFIRMERQERIHKKEKTRVFFQVSVSRVMERSLSTALASGVKLLQHKSSGQVKIDLKNWISGKSICASHRFYLGQVPRPSVTWRLGLLLFRVLTPRVFSGFCSGSSSRGESLHEYAAAEFYHIFTWSNFWSLRVRWTDYSLLPSGKGNTD